MIGSSRETSRQDSHDSHHRRKGEEDIKRKEDIKEQEPYDKKTTMTTSSRTSSIKNHIWTCYCSQRFPVLWSFLANLLDFPCFLAFRLFGVLRAKVTICHKNWGKNAKRTMVPFSVVKSAKLDKTCYQTWEKTPKGQMFGGGSHKSPDD